MEPTAALTIYWDLLIRAHSILAVLIFYMLIPAMFITRKGSPFHRKLGQYTLLLLMIFYISGQMIIFYESIFVSTTNLLIRDNILEVLFRDHYIVMLENTVAFALVAVSFFSIRSPKRHFLQNTFIIIVLLGSIGLMSVSFSDLHAERQIILASLGFLIVMPDIVFMIRFGKTYRSGFLQHAYYIIATFVYAAVFQEITSSAPLVLKCCLSIVGCLPILYLYLPAPNKHLVAQRSIHPLLGFFIILTYFTCLVYGEYYHFRHDCLNPRIPKYPIMCHYMLNFNL